MENDIDLDLIRKRLDTLRPVTRAVFLLHRIDELDYAIPGTPQFRHRNSGDTTAIPGTPTAIPGTPAIPGTQYLIDGASPIT